MKPNASLLVLTLSVLATAAQAAEPWSLGDCNPAGKAAWQAFESKVRSAPPGTLFYVPKPYPKTDREVLADYLYQYKSLHREALVRRDLPANEGPVLDGILAQTVKFAVTRVENWTPLRCAADKKRDFYYLVQVTDATGRRELTRVVLDSSGLLFLIANHSPEVERARAGSRREPLGDAGQALAQAKLGIAGKAPQWVTAFGSLDCNFTTPCVAFRHGTGAYVLAQGDLFELPVTGKRLVQGQDVGVPEKNAALQSSLAPDERFLSLGGSSWIVAHKVDAARLRE